MKQYLTRVWEFIKKAWKVFLLVYTLLLFAFEILVVITLFSISITGGVLVIVFFIVFDIFWIYAYGKKSIYVTIMLSSSLLVIIGTAATYSLIYNIGKNPEIFESLKVGETGDWIGYFGSIIGGLMTMFALFFTIQNENAKQARDEQLKLLPYIECTKISNDPLSIFDTHLGLHFTNISNNPARNIYVDYYGSYIEQNQTKIPFTMNKNHKSDIIDYIAPNQTKILNIFAPIIEKESLHTEANLHIKVIFKNQILKGDYTLEIGINGSFDRPNKTTLFVLDLDDFILTNKVNL